MIETRYDLKRIIKIEKKSYGLSLGRVILGFFGLSELGIIWRYQKNLRKYEYHLNRKHILLSKLYHFKANKIGLKFGMIISPNSVDEGMRICHLGSIVIRGKIGKNATIHINTALVGGGSIDEAPICGNNLYLGIGSTIVGPVTLGDNVCVGAGAVVTKSFQSNCTIAGVPAKIISNIGPLDWHNNK